MKHPIDVLAAEQAEWSQRTFGSDKERGPTGALRHLIEEAGEALLAPDDAYEYADCLLLILDAARRAGIGLYSLLDAAQKKMEINRQRTFIVAADGQPSHHAKS